MTIYPHNRKLADWINNAAKARAMYTVHTNRRSIMVLDKKVIGPYGLMPVESTRYSREEVIRVEETA